MTLPVQPFLQWRVVAELQASLEEHAVSLGLILDELIEHCLVAAL
jgi:hypothetical protein